MHKAIQSTRENISRVRYLGGLHKALLSLTTSAVDSSDILRAQIVLSVSALDYYIHEITVIGMIEVLEGKRTPTSAFSKYRVSMDSVQGKGFVSGSGWFESDVRERHSFLSFQQPDKIADAIRLFSDVKLWQAVGVKMSMPDSDVKAQLRLIVDRRNKIAHEADIDPSYPGARWSINEKDVERSIHFIEQVCESIHFAIT